MRVSGRTVFDGPPSAVAVSHIVRHLPRVQECLDELILALADEAHAQRLPGVGLLPASDPNLIHFPTSTSVGRGVLVEARPAANGNIP